MTDFLSVFRGVFYLFPPRPCPPPLLTCPPWYRFPHPQPSYSLSYVLKYMLLIWSCRTWTLIDVVAVFWLAWMIWGFKLGLACARLDIAVLSTVVYVVKYESASMVERPGSSFSGIYSPILGLWKCPSRLSAFYFSRGYLYTSLDLVLIFFHVLSIFLTILCDF